MLKTLKSKYFNAGIELYNTVFRRVLPRVSPGSTHPGLKEIEGRALRNPSDISDYLTTIFCEVLAAQPRLIVELGVRAGESRFALEEAAKLNESCLVSVDVADSGSVCRQSPRWYFVKDDDIHFAGIFRQWCSERGIEPAVDVLFIDTSHIYEYTVQEIHTWFPCLSTNCKVIFHDTNLKRFCRRLDGTIAGGWDNKRGVIRAIEEYLGTQFNERMDFVSTARGWLVRHWAHCNGLTVMERKGLLTEATERNDLQRAEARLAQR